MQFYTDYGDPVVQRLAKAVCRKRGHDPELLVTDNGYPDAPLVPLWWQYQDDAMNFLAMMQDMVESKP